MKKPPPGTTRVYEADLERDFGADPRNANKGTERGHALLERSISELGAGRSIVADKNGLIPAGNKTREALIAAGMKRALVVETDGNTPVVVKRTDWDLADKKNKARRYAYMDNRVAELDLDWDTGILLKDFQDGVDLKDLWSDKELQGLLAEDKKATVEDEPPEPPKVATSKLGDLYILGEHRLLCGDSNLEATSALVREDKQVPLVWTDPPWNVAIGTHQAYGDKKKYRPIENDDLGEGFPDFAAAFARSFAAALRPGGLCYVAMSTQEWPVVDAAMRAAGMHWSSTIIWVKDALILSQKDYHTRYEPIWYGWLGNAPRIYPLKDRTQSDVWEIPRPRRSDEHPTMKPVELVAKSIQNSSTEGDEVFEPFCGSGTTLIACEQLGRRCRAIELDPRYCDVIVERWEALTGKKAERKRPGAPGVAAARRAKPAAAKKAAGPAKVAKAGKRSVGSR